MKLLTSTLYLLALLTLTSSRKQPERVLLSSVKSLTLRQGLKVAHNRVSPIPQLKCVGGTAKGLYDIDVLRCKNAGSSYNEADVEWTCAASLPPEFKLGSTDVSCEGFSGPDDPYVLKGSCGVEYRLMLTDAGEEKYGKKGSSTWDDIPGRSKGGDVMAVLFWLAFIGVLGWMIYAAFFRGGAARQPGGALGGWGGGGGGGGGDDPPPPYDYQSPPPKPKTNTSFGFSGSTAPPAQEGWRPGFWTGAAGGAAASYLASNRGNQTRQQQPRAPDTWGNGEGSSGWGGASTRPSGSSSSSSSFGSSRYESTGFGGTSRR